MKTIKMKIMFAGYCSNIERTVLKNGNLKIIHFPATFAVLKHPTRGYFLYDSGYSSHFQAQVKKFPFFIYNLLVPVNFTKEQSAKYQLAKIGIKCTDIKTIIISHFHADHIGGLRDFPKAKFICSKREYSSIKEKKGFSALKKVFFPELLPVDFEKRCIWSEEMDNKMLDRSFYPFTKGIDIFNDGSFILIKLEGHTSGQIGLVVSTNKSRYFLISDAAYQKSSYKNNNLPGYLARRINHDGRLYSHNLKKLYIFYKKHPETTIIPSHCEETINELVKKEL